MTQEFADLGLRASLVEATRKAGYESPTSLQRMAIPVLRRGGNAVLYAAPGAGVTATWGLAILDQLAALEDLAVEPGAPMALVVVATEQRANQVASSVTRLQALAGDDEAVQRTRVRAFARGWRQPTDSTLLVSSLAGVVNAVRASELKLEELKVAVLEGVPTLLGLEGEAAMEALMVSVPHEAQHVVTSSENSRTLRHFVEAQVRKPMHFPPPSTTLDEEQTGEATVEGVLSYLVVPEWLKSDTLSRLLARKRESPPIVWTRSEERASGIRRELGRRGYRAGSDPATNDVVVAWGIVPPKRTRISYDVPFDAEGLSQLDAQDGLVMVQAREIAHLRMIARQADREVRAVGRERTARDALAAFRAEIRRALTEEDLELHLAALEPLFMERSAEEVAAALSAIARRRVPVAPTPQPQPAAMKTTINYTKLFVSTGQRDGIRPVDIVGAITGETGLKGDRVGRVDIRDTFSVVEVDAESAERVIRALNGITMKGRSLRVDYDRRTTPGAPALRRRPPNNRPQ